MATLIKIDRNGSKHFEGEVECPRCSGKGIYYIGEMNGRLLPSWVDNGVCFQCGGSGRVMGKWVEHTPEYQAKLDAKAAAQRAEAEARFAAEQAEREAKEEAERLAKEEEAKRIAAEKQISQYVGEIGEKIDLKLYFVKAAQWEQVPFCGFGTELMSCYTFEDDSHNKIVWKTTSYSNFLHDEAQAGAEVHVKGTIKAHSEYKDEKQTVLTRCKVERV